MYRLFVCSFSPPVVCQSTPKRGRLSLASQGRPGRAPGRAAALPRRTRRPKTTPPDYVLSLSLSFALSQMPEARAAVRPHLKQAPQRHGGVDAVCVRVYVRRS